MEIVNAGNAFPGMKAVLHVLNLEESIDFYTKALGMKLLRKRSNVNNRPREASLCAYLVSCLLSFNFLNIHTFIACV